jgi:hypothetical protein
VKYGAFCYWLVFLARTLCTWSGLTMGLYRDMIFPHLLDFVMSRTNMMEQRGQTTSLFYPVKVRPRPQK